MTDLYIKRLDFFLEQHLSQCVIPAETVRQAIIYSLFPGGKRMRPVLVYLAGDLMDLDIDTRDVIAAAIELTHCYSLIHDDLPAMDNDDFRRGKPSCHKAFDEATAILVGDGMQAMAIELLLTKLPALIGSDKTIAVTRELVKASGASGMVSGQSLDLSELVKPDLTDEALKEVHHLKTGRLISACFEMVMTASNPLQETQQRAIRTYAKHIGLVFQIQDDYLDSYAPKHLLGKHRASDEANQKTTFASLYPRKQLEDEISRHYQIAYAALDVFGDKAMPLEAFTRQLQKRSDLMSAS